MPVPEPLPSMTRSDIKRAGGTERMRRHRAQRRAGIVRVDFYLSAQGIGLLVALGWLAESDQQNPQAAKEAFNRFVDRAATVGIRPTH